MQHRTHNRARWSAYSIRRTRRLRDQLSGGYLSILRLVEAGRRGSSLVGDPMRELVKLLQSRVNWLPNRVLHCSSVVGGDTSLISFTIRLEMRRTDDLLAVPAPHFIGLVSIGRPDRPPQLFLKEAAGPAQRPVSAPVFLQAYGNLEGDFAGLRRRSPHRGRGEGGRSFSVPAGTVSSNRTMRLPVPPPSSLSAAKRHGAMLTTEPHLAAR
jgi:hypothetical protein